MLSMFALVGAYLRANLKAAFEYRVSFASEMLAMLVNDCMWLGFWIAFYERYPVVHGWVRADVVTLWAIVATAFGVATALFGNVVRLAGIVARGELDVYLALPRPVLLHALISRMSLTAWGDVVFGVGVFAWLTQPTAADWLLFATLCASNVGIFVGFGALVSSAGFWIGPAEGLAQQAMNILISFSTYPTTIFRGSVKLVLLSVVPAGFLGFVPAEILRARSPHWLIAHFAVSLAFVALGSLVFARGLRRYESGNLSVVRT